MMPKHHKSHLLPISYQSNHCGVLGSSLTMFNQLLARTGLPTGSIWTADPVQKAKMGDFSYKNSRAGSAVMPKHHKSHLLLIFCPSDHCGAPGNSLMVINRVLSRTGSADRVDRGGRPGLKAKNHGKFRIFGVLAPGAIAGCCRIGLWMSWECVGGSIPRPARQQSKSGIFRYFPEKSRFWGPPFGAVPPYFRRLYLRAQRESDKIPDM